MAAATEHYMGFDPYRAWLNVREPRRPLNAYQLLALTSPEDSVEAIREAASQKRAALEAHRDEASPEVWQQVSDELEEAISVLTDADRKLAYDLGLELQDEHRPMPKLGLTADREQHSGSHCSSCGAGNVATRRFCAQCGAHLWEPCFQCGTLCSSGEKFCGTCGANLAAVIRQQIEQFEGRILEVQKLQAQCRYDEAISLLEPMAQAEHPRLSRYVARAAQLVKQLAARRDQHCSAAEAALVEGRRCLEQHDYENAARLLESVAPGLRNEEFQNLLGDVLARRQEFTALTDEVRQGLRAKQPSELLPKIGRILELKPDNAQFRQLALQLQQRYCRAAEAKLAQFQYQQGLALLEQIPESVRSAEANQLYERTAELAWLDRDLRTAPVIDKPLLAAAQRLRTLSPADARNDKLCEELQRRIKTSAAENRITATEWVPAPAKSLLGVPIEWMSGFRRLTCGDEAAAKVLQENPGCLAVACGLALQGVGLAALDINLSRSAGAGILGMFGRKRAAAAWGLDIGASGVKAVKLTWDKNQPAPTIEAATFLEHRKLLSQAGNEIEEQALLEESLRTFVSVNDAKGERVCVGLPSRIVLNRQFQLPPAATAKIPAMVEYEARRQIPVKLEELAWGYCCLADSEAGQSAAEPKRPARKESPKTERDVLLIAAKKTLIQRRVGLLERVGLRAGVVQSECVALQNLLLYECQPTAAPAAPASPPSAWPIAVLDLASDAGNFMVLSPRLLWTRNLGFGGHSLSKIIVKEMNLTLARAEEIKRNPISAPSVQKLYRLLEPAFEEFVKEVQAAIDLFSKSQQYQPIVRLVAVGGAFRFHGLLRYLITGK
ncbi:MAG: pilus assembly protein PilM [Thermoguttaceae bacterium]